MRNWKRLRAWRAVGRCTRKISRSSSTISGVALSKQNVSYAEIAVAPSDFVGSAQMNFDTFIDALNDGRDRALRGWGVDMAWILCVPRDNPRAGDDVARWSSGSAAAARNIVAMGLTGREDAQPIGAVPPGIRHRAKERSTHHGQCRQRPGRPRHRGGSKRAGAAAPGSIPGASREDPGLLNHIVESGLPLVVSMSRAQRMGLIKKMGDYPLKTLYEAKVQIMLASGMPSLYGTTLIDEYVAAVEECGLEIDDLIAIMRRSIDMSYLDEERKAKLLRRFEFDVKTALAAYIGRN